MRERLASAFSTLTFRARSELALSIGTLALGASATLALAIVALFVLIAAAMLCFCLGFLGVRHRRRAGHDEQRSRQREHKSLRHRPISVVKKEKRIRTKCGPLVYGNPQVAARPSVC
jgi:hypothetical protein